MKQTNRLINERSPYLLQHAFNPVDWFTWGKEAFEVAKKENKPIFLSIGYSTCHWCHQMAHESFQDPEIAKVLNENFVSIKVDREERPDVDEVYMNAVMAMTGTGGWPLSVWLTPDGKPFFGGTYFPPEDQFGRTGFKSVLQELATLWKRDRQKVLKQSEQLVQTVRRNLSAGQPGVLSEEVLHEAFRTFSLTFDEVHGGFGRAPKFPTPHNLSFLLRYYDRKHDERALDMVVHTLDSMAMGGIHDHLGGGFHRYSTDSEWFVPHFEKMLYDQALLARAYLEAYQITREVRHAEVARDIFACVLRDLRGPEGAFYSAEDADSEGYEGKFYLWTPADVQEVLGVEIGNLVCRYYDIRERGNFNTHGGHFERGKCHIHTSLDIDAFARKEGKEPEELRAILEDARGKLFAAREKRVRPHRDDKVLADWNGLMISAFSLGFQVFDDPSYVDAAKDAATFILNHMRKSERLLHRYREQESAVPGFLTDYAFLAWGLLDLYEATFDAKWLDEARTLASQMVELFWDEKQSGFWFNSRDSEGLIAGSKETYDGAVPSGNSVAAIVLLLLGEMTGDSHFQSKADQLFKAFGGDVKENPRAHSQLLIAYDFALGPRKEVVIAGEPEKRETQELLKIVRSRFRPRTVVLLHPGGVEAQSIEKLAPFIVEQRPVDGRPAAYVCENYACKMPVSLPSELEKLL